MPTTALSRPPSIILAIKLLWADVVLTFVFESIRFSIDETSVFELFFSGLISLFFLYQISNGSNFWRCAYGFVFAFFLGLVPFFALMDFFEAYLEAKDKVSHDVIKHVVRQLIQQTVNQSSALDGFYGFSSLVLSIAIICKLFSREANEFFGRQP